MRFRQLLRILALSTAIALLFLALFSQAYDTLLQHHHATLSIEEGGLKFWTNPDFERPHRFTIASNYPYWKARDLLLMPDFLSDGSERSLALPWWLLIPTSALAAALLCWLTRTPKPGRAFPITQHPENLPTPLPKI
jgi:hypothetical protein